MGYHLTDKQCQRVQEANACLHQRCDKVLQNYTQYCRYVPLRVSGNVMTLILPYLYHRNIAIPQINSYNRLVPASFHDCTGKQAREVLAGSCSESLITVSNLALMYVCKSTYIHA